MKIGSVVLPDYPLFLAPMEDVTHRAFRKLCKSFGADVVYTEFTASDALIRNVKKAQDKVRFIEQERPMGIQLYGHLLDSMVEAAKIVETQQPDFIDLNFGCPVKKIANRGAGSGMLRNIPLLVEITKQIVKAVNIPVTVKTRLGWDDASLVIDSLAEQLQDVGIQALTIHGRTRQQLYTGTANWELIAKVKSNPRLHIPIIGNGDISTPEGAKICFDKYGVDGIMIGRGVIGRPWFFREIRHYLSTGELQSPPDVLTLADLGENMLEEMFAEHEIDHVAVTQMKRHFSRMFVAIPHFKELRIKLLRSNTMGEVKQTLQEIRNTYSTFDTKG